MQRGVAVGGVEGSHGGHLAAILWRREINPERRRCRDPGTVCVQATWLYCSAVSESWIREDGAELAQELCSAGG